MVSEANVSKLVDIFDRLVNIAGSSENTRIIPNLEVIDAAPPAPIPAGYIIVRNEQGFYGPVLKLPGLTYANGDLVNVLFVKGTEPVAMQQGSGSAGSNTGRVSEVYDETLTNIVIDIDASGNVAINAAQADRDLSIGWDSGTALSTDGATGNVTVSSVIDRTGDADTKITFTDDKIALTAGGVEFLAAIEGATDELVVNDGSADVDFRVESDTNTAALFVEGSTGNVGIGTGSPAVGPSNIYGLHIKGSNNTGIFVDAGTGTNAIYYMGVNGAAKWHFQYESSGNYAITETGVAVRLRIAPGGNLAVGTSTPNTAAGAVFQVQGAFGMARIGSATGVGATPVNLITGLTDGIMMMYWAKDSAGSNAQGSFPIYSGVGHVVGFAGGNFTIDWNSGNIRFYRSSGSNTGSIIMWAVGN